MDMIYASAKNLWDSLRAGNTAYSFLKTQIASFCTEFGLYGWSFELQTLAVEHWLENFEKEKILRQHQQSVEIQRVIEDALALYTTKLMVSQRVPALTVLALKKQWEDQPWAMKSIHRGAREGIRRLALSEDFSRLSEMISYFLDEKRTKKEEESLEDVAWAGVAEGFIDAIEGQDKYRVYKIYHLAALNKEKDKKDIILGQAYLKKSFVSKERFCFTFEGILQDCETVVCGSGESLEMLRANIQFSIKRGQEEGAYSFLDVICRLPAHAHNMKLILSGFEGAEDLQQKWIIRRFERMANRGCIREAEKAIHYAAENFSFHVKGKNAYIHYVEEYLKACFPKKGKEQDFEYDFEQTATLFERVDKNSFLFKALFFSAQIVLDPLVVAARRGEPKALISFARLVDIVQNLGETEKNCLSVMINKRLDQKWPSRSFPRKDNFFFSGNQLIC